MVTRSTTTTTKPKHNQQSHQACLGPTTPEHSPNPHHAAGGSDTGRSTNICTSGSLSTTRSRLPATHTRGENKDTSKPTGRQHRGTPEKEELREAHWPTHRAQTPQRSQQQKWATPRSRKQYRKGGVGRGGLSHAGVPVKTGRLAGTSPNYPTRTGNDHGGTTGAPARPTPPQPLFFFLFFSFFPFFQYFFLGISGRSGREGGGGAPASAAISTQSPAELKRALGFECFRE